MDVFLNFYIFKNETFYQFVFMREREREREREERDYYSLVRMRSFDMTYAHQNCTIYIRIFIQPGLYFQSSSQTEGCSCNRRPEVMVGGECWKEQCFCFVRR